MHWKNDRLSLFARAFIIAFLGLFGPLGPVDFSRHADGAELIAFEKQIWAYHPAEEMQNWKQNDFDDSKWKKGIAPLGFGEPQIATIVARPEGAQEVPITTFFRSKFQVHEKPERLLLKTRVDDGFVLHLNGKEAIRYNLPQGEIRPSTPAISGISGVMEELVQKFELEAGDLTLGENTICVEVHQVGVQSSDLYLDLSLDGLDGVQNRAIVSEEARDATLAYNSLHRIDEDTVIPDGFLDGGRGMQIDEWGYAVSGREIIRVDRSVDKSLAKYLEFSRSDELKKLSEVDRATRIARFVDRVYTPDEGRGTCVSRSRYLQQRYASQEVLLGDVTNLCTAGVCRHRSLLFKILADEAGLRSNVIRGNYSDGKTSGGHAWNELILNDGTKVIVDIMNPKPDFYFPKVGEPSLRWYRTIANNAKYESD